MLQSNIMEGSSFLMKIATAKFEIKEKEKQTKKSTCILYKRRGSKLTLPRSPETS